MELSDVVEDLMTYVPLAPGGARRTLPEAVLTDQVGDHPLFANVGRLRADDVAALVTRARDFFAERGREHFVWFVGPSSHPPDLLTQLADHGAERLDVGTALALTEEPASGPVVDIRPVNDVASMRDWEAVAEVERASHAPGSPTPPSRAEALLAAQQGTPGRTAYVAYDERGEPVSAAGLIVTDHGVCIMSGGATVPHARGRGYYTALIAHRWRVAVEAGVPVLAVHASRMSQPVLSKVGFRSVATIEILRSATTP